jgi:hypothetical protein
LAAAQVATAPALPAPQGAWGVPMQHDVTVAPGFIHVPNPGPNGQRFKALHLAVIPQPAANAGLVVGLDSQGQGGAGGGWFQRWTVVDPSTDPPTVLWNDEIFLPGIDAGDLFCSGHTWTSDGRLVVAGGTSKYAAVEGANHVLIYDPTPTGLDPYGTWSLAPPMAKHRWYPTVTLLGDGTVMVSGGLHINGVENTYEVYDPVSNTWQVDPNTGNPWFPGPPVASGADFGLYPRMHVLSDGTVVKTGERPQAARVDHLANPGVWQLLGASSTIRHDGASVLFPVPFGQQDLAVILGGDIPIIDVAPATTEYTQPTQAGATWAAGPTMNRKRGHLNTVILPDGTLLSIGGEDHVSGPVFWKDAEWLSGTTWHPMVAGASVRDYHSTAALLPDGTVLSAGGDNRDWDYQLFYPPYFDLNRPRPNNVTAPATMGYSGNGAGPYTATFSALPSGVTLSKAVLMAPASTTHHSDMHQRAADLLINSQTSTSVTFHTPWDRCVGPNPLHSCAPPGYYMLFLVTNQGVPSRAVWVLLQ